MDSLPLTANALGRFFHIDGREVERYYKHHLSDFDTWNQKEHATDWVLLAQNIGEYWRRLNLPWEPEVVNQRLRIDDT